KTDLFTEGLFPDETSRGPMRPCPCRKPHPCRSRGILVLVEDSAEALASSYVQPGDLAAVGDWRGQRDAWSGVRDALVRPVLVVKSFELTQGMQKMALVPDQGSIEEFTAAGQHPPLHDRVHSRHPHAGEHDLDARVGQDRVEQLRVLTV